MLHYMCIDIGGTAIKYCLASKEGKLSEVRQLKTPKTMEEFLETLSLMVEEYDEEIEGIAISMPGLINSKTGYAVHGGSLLFIKDINIRDTIGACFPDIPVEIENDGKCAALGEKYFGELHSVENGIAIVLGTGIGGGIIINGQLMRGTNLSAGEFSFIRNSPVTERPENFLGLQLSVPLMIREYTEKSTDSSEILTGEQLFQKINEEDDLAIAVLRKYSKRLTQQLFNLQTIIDPEVITIGGGISAQSKLIDFINEDIEEEMNRFPIPLIKPAIKQSKLGNKANLLGALAHYVEHKAN